MVKGPLVKEAPTTNKERANHIYQEANFTTMRQPQGGKYGSIVAVAATNG